MNTSFLVITVLSAISIVLITAFCARIGKRADVQARKTQSTFLLFGGLGLCFLAAAWITISFVFAGKGGLPPREDNWQPGAILIAGGLCVLMLWIIVIARLIRGKQQQISKATHQQTEKK